MHLNPYLVILIQLQVVLLIFHHFFYWNLKPFLKIFRIFFFSYLYGFRFLNTCETTMGKLLFKFNQFVNSIKICFIIFLVLVFYCIFTYDFHGVCFSCIKNLITILYLFNQKNLTECTFPDAIYGLKISQCLFVGLFFGIYNINFGYLAKFVLRCQTHHL
jgi:hypothetical protein